MEATKTKREIDPEALNWVERLHEVNAAKVLSPYRAACARVAQLEAELVDAKAAAHRAMADTLRYVDTYWSLTEIESASRGGRS